ncbi:MAG TPA: protein kinase [Pirellulales bacterium]
MRWRAGRLSQAEGAAIEAHVSRCTGACHQVLSSLPPRTKNRKSGATPGRNDATATFDSKHRATQPDNLLDPAPARPQRFGRFEILELLGKGAFGAVYRARDTQLGRVVALKIPRKGLLQSADERERFLREAKAAATLHHPNICPLHEAGELDGRQYMVMTLIDGEPLSKLIERGRPLAERSAATIVRKLAQALSEAHRKGIVHRDIKPGNIIIDRRGQPVLMDFGLARRYDANEATLTASGDLVGTPAYMAPEQALSRHDQIGPPTDIYALGVVLYELLTGHRPFEGDTSAVLGQIATAEPRPPSALRAGLDLRLDAICRRALSKHPAARFGSMREFAEALREYLKAAEASQAGGFPSLDAPEFVQLVSGLNTQLATIAKRQRVAWWRWAIAPAAIVVAILLGWLLVPRGPLVVTNVGIDPQLLADASLSFFLDDREITAKQAQEPMELAPGDHELLVRRQELVVKHYRFHVEPPLVSADVTQPPVAEIELREVKEVAVVKLPPPVLRWDFEGAGVDEKASVSDGKPGKTRTAPGIRGQAAAFSGAGDQITVADDPWLHAKSALTVAAWVHPNSARAGHVAGRWSTKGSYLLDWADGVYSFRVAYPVGGTTGTPVAIQAFGATGQWSHVVAVYDGAKLSLYMDGQLTASQELARSELLRRTVEFARRGEIPTALQDNRQPFELGGGGFQGLIDEVDFWDVALSAEQVTKLFESYPPAPSPPPSASGEIADAADADRRIAEWVISRGGSVVIPGPNNRFAQIQTINDLPREPFSLQNISLFDDLSPTDEDLARLDLVADLKGIAISSFSNGDSGLLTEEGIVKFLRAHPYLQDIYLDTRHGGLDLTDASLEAACQCPNLMSLFLWIPKLTDAGMADLEKVANQLIHLHLPASGNLTDASLPHISALRNLATLNLSGRGFTDDGVAGLPQILKLPTLRIWGTATGDPLAARLADSRHLDTLDMCYTEITNAGLEHLARIKTLHGLGLEGTTITDASVRHLKRLTRLKNLGVTHTKLTQVGVDELRAALPQCTIHSDFGTFEPQVTRP